MQIKGAIRLVAVLLAIICAYYLSFSIVTSKVKNEAEEYAEGNLNKQQEYLDSIAGEVVYDIGIQEYTFRECQEREINLGLDLKGGMNGILEISVKDIIVSLSNNSQDSTFRAALNRAKEMQKESQEDFLTLFSRAFNQIDPDARLSAIFNTYELKDKIDFESSNQEVLKILRKEANAAIDNSFNVLRTRIDRFGVVSPNIQRLENTGRILVELPGVKDQERVKGLLQATASLEFWETYENPEVYPYLEDANQKIKEIREAEDKIVKDTTQQETEQEETPLLQDEKEEVEADTSEESLIDEIEQDTSLQDTSLRAQQMAKEHPLFSILKPMVNRNNQLMNSPVVGVAHFNDTAQVNHYLKMKKVRSIFPRDLEFLWGVKAYDDNEEFFPLYAIKKTGREGKAPLTGEVVKDVNAQFGRNQARAEVLMSMNADGAKIWARLTKNNVQKFIAIVLDGYVYSAPRVNQEITGGQSSISGDFTVKEAKELANVLKSGKLPAPVRIIEENL